MPDIAFLKKIHFSVGGYKNCWRVWKTLVFGLENTKKAYRKCGKLPDKKYTIPLNDIIQFIKRP